MTRGKSQWRLLRPTMSECTLQTLQTTTTKANNGMRKTQRYLPTVDYLPVSADGKEEKSNGDFRSGGSSFQGVNILDPLLKIE
jgi:hypothetical protein